MEQPRLDEYQRAFASYLTLWMTYFIEGLNDAHLLEKIRRHPDGSVSEECKQMRICIEKAIAISVKEYFNRMENQQVLSEANRIINHR